MRNTGTGLVGWVLDYIGEGGGFVRLVDLLNDDGLGEGLELVQVALYAHDEDDGSDLVRFARFICRTLVLKRATLKLPASG